MTRYKKLSGFTHNRKLVYMFASTTLYYKLFDKKETETCSHGVSVPKVILCLLQTYDLLTLWVRLRDINVYPVL